MEVALYQRTSCRNEHGVTEITWIARLMPRLMGLIFWRGTMNEEPRTLRQLVIDNAYYMRFQGIDCYTLLFHPKMIPYHWHRKVKKIVESSESVE